MKLAVIGASALAGHPLVIHAYNPGRGRTDSNIFDLLVAGHRSILKAATSAGVPRLLYEVETPAHHCQRFTVGY